ncbi:MAG TPA: HK97-gp10 family putative phage morphogenesis protein [Candidatus Acidoferrum sp.]|nr:HK97-gp10 family putative phage morphogenesis protein [Candidatus Acidoferrum sp.]
MSAIVSVKISGLEELADALERKPLAAAKAVVRKCLRASARVFWQEMRQRVRRGWHVFESKGSGRSREFGFLADHIGIKIRVRGDELGGTAQVGPVKKGYWELFLEFGTRKMAAIPFIRPAFESRKQDALDKYISTARESLKQDMGIS